MDGWDDSTNVAAIVCDDANNILDISAPIFDDGDGWDGGTNMKAFIFNDGVS